MQGLEARAHSACDVVGSGCHGEGVGGCRKPRGGGGGGRTCSSNQLRCYWHLPSLSSSWFGFAQGSWEEVRGLTTILLWQVCDLQPKLGSRCPPPDYTKVGQLPWFLPVHSPAHNSACLSPPTSALIQPFTRPGGLLSSFWLSQSASQPVRYPSFGAGDIFLRVSGACSIPEA